MGDFEPHRDTTDLATMDAPAKYRQLGDFPDFYTGRVVFPWSVYFIGGNHEPYGFLDQTPLGAQIAKNCHYLGRVGSVVVAGLKIVGVSGIYREDLFVHTARPSVSQIGSRPNKDYISFTEDEIAQALEEQSADILLLHEWPAGVIAPDDEKAFRQWRSSLRYQQVGNEYARMLTEFLKPKLVLCGHMHKSYRNQIQIAPDAVCDICCLANIAQEQDAIAVFHQSPDGRIEEVN